MTSLTSLAGQLDRLIDLDLSELAGITAAQLSELADGLTLGEGDLLAIHPTLVPPDRLAPLLHRHGKPGFVVEDLIDLDEFTPLPDLDVPDRPLYAVRGLDRGDDLRNQSPEEALPVLVARGRTPLTIGEGISWLLQRPDLLEPNHCFMCIGSRRPKPGARGGLDARTPAVWISGGTGRDGRERKDAPKVGWCWAGNRHTWLGIASCRSRGVS